MSSFHYTAGEIWKAIEDDIEEAEKLEKTRSVDSYVSDAEDWLVGMKFLAKMDSDRLVVLTHKEAEIVEMARETGVVVTKGRPFSLNYNPPDFDREIFPDPAAIYDRRGRLIVSFESCQELANYLAKKWPDLDPQSLLVQG